eukprot:6171193-Pyramimonas_sp.AAC.1
MLARDFRRDGNQRHQLLASVRFALGPVIPTNQAGEKDQGHARDFYPRLVAGAFGVGLGRN